MGIKVKKIISLLIFLKYVSPVIATIYLFGWLIQGMNPILFAFLNFVFGYIPSIIDKIHLIRIELFGKYAVSMGYAYTACIFIFFYYFSNILIGKFDKIYQTQKDEEHRQLLMKQQYLREKRLKEIKEQKKKNPKVQITLPFDKKVFFGLFEFQLESLKENDESELNKLKAEFSRIMVKKLQENYPKVNFFADDKIFFYYDDFSSFGLFTKNILTLFKTFMQTGMAQSIKLGMLFSYWIENNASKKEEVFKILCKMNELGYLNKIVVSSGVYYRFMREEDNKFIEFEPMGTARLFGVSDDNDMDIDIYSITKVE